MISNFSTSMFENPGHDGRLIRVAATTCYRSEDKSKLSANDFIRMLKKNKHTAMLEFSWFVIGIKDFYMVDFSDPYLKTTVFYDEKRKCTTYISGNGRAWLNFGLRQCFSENIFQSIKILLNLINPILFDFQINEFHKSVIDSRVYDATNKIINIPQLHDDHHWIMMKYEGVSRGFTHEVIRHRTMSFAQMSTRYVTCENFEYIGFPENAEINPELQLDIETWVEHTKNLYDVMKNTYGYKNDTIRQLLPNGLSNEICIAGRLGDWKKMFKLRVAKDAHWEIQSVMTQTLLMFMANGLITEKSIAEFV